MNQTPVNPQAETEIQAQIVQKKAELEFLNKATRALHQVKEATAREEEDGDIAKLEEEINAV